jgi:COP9 signalosome complex subunit 5
VQTQTAWQTSLHSWTAIVVDPLRSLAKQEPELGAFRIYPPKHTPPANECPDGSQMTDDQSRVVRWGHSHARYYALRISYFMSSLGSRMLDTMSKNNLWVRVLSSSSIMETETRQRFAERVRKAAEKIESAENAVSSASMARFGYSSHHGIASTKRKGVNEELARVSQTW